MIEANRRARRAGAILALTTALLAPGALAQGADFDATGFSISVGDETIAGAPAPRAPPRVPDRTLDALGLDLRFDGLVTDRRLAVSASRSGDAVRFRAASNYPAYVTRTEVVVLDRTAFGRPVVAILPVAPNGAVDWTVPAGGAGRYAYLLRATDARGRRDETRAVALDAATAAGDPFVRPDLGQDMRARIGIPAGGGTVTVSGTGPPGGRVAVMGEAVEVDAAGRFAIERILPAGDHVVAVEAGGRRLVRDVRIPERDVFGTGIVDITLGRERGGPRDGSEGVADARLAYYVKGRTAGGWTITSSADTEEGRIEDLFSRLGDKDPDRVLDRLRAEADLLYPTYGDDSTLFDDTPTRGNVYLRVENDTTRLTFGDFAAGVTGPGLLQNTRDLYGLELRHRSASVTPEGDARYAFAAYVAQPDTLGQRDVLLATGGSIYFLSRQDVAFATVKATVQVRDRNTGFVVETIVLQEGRDFTVDHIQGVVVLTRPLATFASDPTLIDDAGADYVQALVVQYEYVPTAGAPSDVAWGGRAEVWATDRLRLGATAMTENTASGDDQRMLGADLHYRLSETSFASLEVARADGPGIARALSADGGLTLLSSSGAAGSGAALRFDGRFALADLGIARDGFLAVRAEHLEAGFSTLTEDVTADRSTLGLDGEVALSARTSISGAFERYRVDGGVARDEGEVAMRHALTERLSLRAGLALLDRADPADPSDDGRRTDAGLRLTYDVSDALSVSAFGQATVTHSGGIGRNDRAGAGITARVGERFTLDAEASGGDGGARAAARLGYAAGPEHEAYLGYTLDPTRTDGGGLDDDGTVVVGGRTRLSPSVTSWSESVLDMPGPKRSLTRAYGVSWTPAPSWTVAGSVEVGTVDDRTFGVFDRGAVSFGAVWAPSDERSGRVRVELRDDEGDGTTRDRRTYALTAAYADQISPEWRLVGDIEALVSRSAQGSLRDGEYVRATLGYAYRPVEDERLNLLFGLSHLRDLPGPDQVTVATGSGGPEQISNVASLNASYDLSRRFTLGGKLGYRQSRIAPRGTGAFVDDAALLTALRIDWAVLNRWDALLEGRVLHGFDTGTTETGALAGVYRHVGRNVKVGLLYEFGTVSDDVTRIDYDSQGILLNVVGKF